MRKLASYLKGYRKESILGPLFKLIEATFELLVPLVIAALIDRGIGGESRGTIVGLCAVLVGLGLVGLACSLTAQYFAAKASVGFVKKLKHALFEHIQGFSYTTLDRLGTSTLITRLTSDMNQVQTGLNLTLRLLLRSPFVVFGAMVMAFTIDVKSALWFVVAIPLLSVVVFGVMLACIPLYRKVQEKLDRVLGITRENLTGVRVLRALGQEEAQVREFGARNDELTAMQKVVGRVSALMNPVTYVIINLAIVALIRQGAVRVDAGILTQGQVVALYNYMSQILVELIKLANLIINITKSAACAKRIQAVLELPSGEPEKDGCQAGDEALAVEFDHASLRYEGAGAPSLIDVSLRVHPGEVVGVIGGTGSGKTSLVNLIPRFYTATEGAVRVFGRDVRQTPVEELRAQIGVVPQKAVLFQGTIRDNLRGGNEQATDEALWRALEIAQASEVVLGKPNGLDEVIEQGGKNLSGGQRQRLTIARALVKQPKILILDDSSSALDFATDAALRKALYHMEPKPTLFIVSQRTSSIQHADQIVVLDEGRAVGVGTHGQLLETCEVYKEIYASQFKRKEEEQ